jgi:hypothetical protein
LVAAQEGRTSESGGAPASGKGIPPAAGCALAVLLALIGGAVCLGFGSLLFRQQITLPGGGPTPGRIWLVREGGNRGLAISTGRVVRGSVDGPEACIETRVRFLLWQSDGTAAASDYCECFRLAGERWISEGQCPP